MKKQLPIFLRTTALTTRRRNPSDSPIVPCRPLRAAIRLPTVGALLFALVAVVALTRLTLPTLRNDFLGFVWLADHLDFFDPRSMATPFYPVGYPMLLALGQKIGLGYWVTAKLLHIGTAAGLVFLVGRLTELLQFTLVARIGAMLVLATSPIFFLESLGEQGHHLSTLAGLGALTAAISSDWGQTATWRQPVLVGVLAGIAYLLQYYALIYLFFALLYLVTRPIPTHVRLLSAGLALLGWLAVASPQLVASWLAHGTPIYSAQSVRIGWGTLGIEPSRFSEFFKLYTLEYLLAEHWEAVLANLTGNFVNHITTGLPAVILPLAFIITWLEWRTLRNFAREPAYEANIEGRRFRALALFTFFAIAFIASISLGFRIPRITIPIIPIAALLIAWFVSIATQRGKLTTVWIAVVMILLISIAGVLEIWRDYVKIQQRGRHFRKMTAVLRNAGVQNSTQVLTTSQQFVYMTDQPDEPLYAVGEPGWVSVEPSVHRERPIVRIESAEQIKETMQSRGFVALVMRGPPPTKLREASGVDSLTQQLEKVYDHKGWRIYTLPIRRQ